MSRVALSILAHPDDAEFLNAGTLIRLKKEHGFSIHIATMTPGDCGSAELPPEQIAAIRREEGRRAAALIGGNYHCLEEKDLRIFYEQKSLEKIVRLLREVRPEIVFTHSPADYMVDHEMTSLLVRAGTFAAPIPNAFRDEGQGNPLDHIPWLYYCDPIEGRNQFGEEIIPGFALEVSAEMPTKIDMLACHASQRDWLLKHHGMDQYLQAARDWSGQRGRQVGVASAEGFRQHLGHGYPQTNILGDLLGALVIHSKT